MHERVKRARRLKSIQRTKRKDKETKRGKKTTEKGCGGGGLYR